MESAANSIESNNWKKLLCQADIPQQFPAELTYRAACIGAIMILYEANDAASLKEVVRHGANPESRTRALLALESLTRAGSGTAKTAIRYLHELAIMDGNREAANFLRKSSLQDEEPGWNSARMLLFEQKSQLFKTDPGPEFLSCLFLQADETIRMRLLTLGEKMIPNWVLLMRFCCDPSAENRSRILDSYKTFSPAERTLIHFCAESDNPHINSLAADLLLRYEDETLLTLCINNGVQPSNHTQEALFYFLSGQWEKYYNADSDYRQIRIAYEQKNPDLQRRLITVSRDSGNNAWLRDISGNQENLPHNGSLSDQHLLTSSLIEQKQWDRLWELLPNLPLLCMPAACRALKESGFIPKYPEEKSFFEDLSGKIAAFENTSAIPIKERYSEGGGTALGICGGNTRTAVLFSNRQILIWDKQEGNAEPLRISSNHLNFRRAILSHDGKYLCADCGNEGITVFTLPGGQAVKTFAAGSVPLTGIFLQNDDRRMITLDRAGKGSIYAFPGGTELGRFDLGMKDCFYAAFEAESRRICGISPEGNCLVYDLGDHRPVNSVHLGSSILNVDETYSKNRIPFIERDATLSVVNLLSGKPVLEKIPFGDNSVCRIAAFSEESLFALGTLDGRILIFDPTVNKVWDILSIGSKAAITGIHIDMKEKMIIACNAAGTVRAWDFSLFSEMIRVLPLLQLPGFNRIDEFVKKYPGPGVKAAAEWLKTVIAWRRRFDIEIE